MQYIFPYRPQDLERIATPIDPQFKIEAYGANNVYPQEQQQLRLGSPLIKTATAVLADFTNGEGFEQNGETVLNDLGEYADDLLNLVAADYSEYNGFALWFGFNGLGQITEAKHIPFEFVRFGIPDKNGIHSDVKVSNNWEQNSDINEGKKIEPVTYPIFNPLTAQEETIRGGSGQVLYYTGRKDKYALSTFDSINDTALTDSEIQAFEKNTSTKGFLGTTLFKYPGNFESKEEQAEIEAKIQSLQGSEGQGILLAKIDEDFTGDLIETIAPNNNDALFSLTRQAIIDRVLQVFSIPPALMGINPQGGVFSQTSYKESFITYGVITRNRRKVVVRVFNTFGALMEDPLSFGKIKESRFEVEGQDLQDQPNQFQTEEETETQEEIKPEADAPST